MHNRLWLLIVLAAVGCSAATDEVRGGMATVIIAAAAETEPSIQDGAEAVAIWLHPDDTAQSLILGAGGTGGLESYGLDGKRFQVVADIEPGPIAVRYGFEIHGKSLPLVMVHEPRSGTVVGYSIGDDRRLHRLPGAPLEARDEVIGLCSYRSAITGRVYLFGTTDAGLLLQWELYAARGELQGRLLRTVPLGRGAESCVVDDASGMLYFSDETLGVLAIPADAEAEPARRTIDLRKPYGNIEEEAKGLALVSYADGSGRLIVADASAGRLAVYSLDGELLGRFAIGAGDGVDAVAEPERFALAALPVGAGFPGGLLVVGDEDNEGAFANFKLVDWRQVATALGMPDLAAVDPRVVQAATARAVMPTLGTEPVSTFGDAADDPAIWVHPTDPLQSLVIGTDKNFGLYVYDLDGRLLQTLPDGRMNNVDLREGFSLAGRTAIIVAASNRTDKSLALYVLDASTRRLARAAPPVPTGLGDPYGMCMYRSSRSGEFYVFINNSGDGLFRQWRILEDGGRLAAEPVRDFLVGTQSEGCVADDETGALYVAEEDGGFWKYSAEPDGGDARTEIDRVDGPNGLVGDIEGVAIWHGRDGKGYLVVSNQGADNYAVYRREGNHPFVGIFHIVADPDRGVDGASETDGLEITSRPLGPEYPEGLLVVQDGRNLTPPAERQNYKYVSWRAIAEALGLSD